MIIFVNRSKDLLVTIFTGTDFIVKKAGIILAFIR